MATSRPLSKRLWFGFDPGTSRLGFSCLDVFSYEMMYQSQDLHYQLGKRYDYAVLDHYDQYVITWLTSEFMKALLSNTEVFCYEENSRVAKANKNVLHVTHSIVQTIRCLYPHIRIVPLIAKDVRTWWKSQGISYKDRKEKSKETDLMIPAEQARYNRTFQVRNTKRILVDPLDAALLLIYYYHHAHLYKILPPSISTKPAHLCDIPTETGIRMLSPLNPKYRRPYVHLVQEIVTSSMADPDTLVRLIGFRLWQQTGEQRKKQRIHVNSNLNPDIPLDSSATSRKRIKKINV